MPLYANTANGAPKYVTSANGENTQVFATNEGWVRRHNKGNGRYWEETLVALGGLANNIGAPTIKAVYFSSVINKTHLRISSVTGTTPLVDSVVYQANSTANLGVSSVLSVNLNSVRVLSITPVAGTIANGATVYQANSTANVAVGTVFLANSTVLIVVPTSGTFNTSNTVQSNSTVNATVTAVATNVAGTMVLQRLSGRHNTSNTLVGFGVGNCVVVTANNYAEGNVTVAFLEKVTVTGGSPTIVVTSDNTPNATATYASGNLSSQLVFTFFANANVQANLSLVGQNITLGGATVNDAIVTATAANVTFANAAVANVALTQPLKIVTV